MSVDDPLAALRAKYPHLGFREPTGRWMNGARPTKAKKKRKSPTKSTVDQFDLGFCAYENDEPFAPDANANWREGWRHAQIKAEST